jgi:hypothetical protein
VVTNRFYRTAALAWNQSDAPCSGSHPWLLPHAGTASSRVFRVASAPHRPIAELWLQMKLPNGGISGRKMHSYAC